jgi:RNA polymerase sigma-70 factor (ECF subfamily)
MRVHAYIRTLVPDRNDAEDGFQVTSVVMWDRFGEFDADADFAAWGCRIAYFKIRELYRKKSRSRLVFSECSLGRSPALVLEPSQ